MTHNLADHQPVNAGVHDIEVVVVDKPIRQPSRGERDRGGDRQRRPSRDGQAHPDLAITLDKLL
jgi:hypothetical protein